ncbi:MAG: NAD(+)/NADH kinase [Spirochaetales bacterium]|nr:MAG: NAD(+)/NADH kinase [Spirochaetales bacterium]
MKRHIKKALIIANLLKAEAGSIIHTIQETLGARGIATEVHGYEGKPISPVVPDIDLALSLGGDGTVLFTARLVAEKGTPILAVNLGDFGFITEVSKDEWQEAFDKYEAGILGISERIMLTSTVIREGRELCSYTGLNDAVISAAGISKIVRLNIFLSNANIGEYRADGVIVSTPTGSTAYSLAAGGPILDPEMDSFILNPICPFTLSNRTLCIQGSELAALEVQERQRADIILTVDGQIAVPLKPKDIIRFKRAAYKALIIRSDKRTFYEVLKTKLNWAGGPDA